MIEATEIQVLAELKECLPPATPEERMRLKEGLERDGMLYGILLCEIQGLPGSYILDGHTRFEIATEIGIAPVFHADDKLLFETIDEAICWIIEHQTARRNLTEQQQKSILAKYYNAFKGSRGGDRKSEESKDQNEPLISTAEKAAREFGVSPATVKRAVSQNEKIEELELQSAVMDGTIKKFEAAALDEIIEEVKAQPERKVEIVEDVIRTARANNGRVRPKRPANQQPEPNAEEDPQADHLLFEITKGVTELIYRARQELDKTRLTKLRSAMHEAFKCALPAPVGNEQKSEENRDTQLSSEED